MLEVAAKDAAAEFADIADDKRGAELGPRDEVGGLCVGDHLVELGDKIVCGHGFPENAHGWDESRDGDLCIVAAT
jgi:hypothetical protein